MLKDCNRIIKVTADKDSVIMVGSRDLLLDCTNCSKILDLSKQEVNTLKKEIKNLNVIQMGQKYLAQIEEKREKVTIQNIKYSRN